MRDANGRQIGYMRLSLIAACQRRCIYCRPDRLCGGCGANQPTAVRKAADRGGDRTLAIALEHSRGVVANLACSFRLCIASVHRSDKQAEPNWEHPTPENQPQKSFG